MTTYGPGVSLLASLTGNDVADVATKPGVALRAVADLAKELARLAADHASADPAVREAAERRAAEITSLAAATPTGE